MTAAIPVLKPVSQIQLSPGSLVTIPHVTWLEFESILQELGACFYIKNYQIMIGRRRLQPGDPPADLALETGVTSKTTLDAYEAIAVPELWIYANKKLSIYVLTEGKYIKSEISPTFPQVPVTQMIPPVIERGWQVGSVQALEEFIIKLDSLK